MKVILFKLIKDFRHAKVKLLLLILATALSAWGISGVAYSYFMTERDFHENFEKTYPADMTLVVDDYKPGLEAMLLSDPNVVDIERREVVYGRIKDSQGSWMPVIMYGIADLNNMRYDRIRVLEAENMGPGKILIEKNAFFFLSQNQERIELMFREDGEVLNWVLSGRAHDARQAPARMEGMVYAYTTSIDLIAPYMKKGQRRLLIKTNQSDDKAELEVIGKRLELICQQYGANLAGVSIPEPGKHIHQGIVDGIAFLQESGGTILSIMGIILLSLILLTWIFPQLTDIGVMKAIGASTNHIFKSYTIVLASIIGIGITVGWPLGYKTAAMYSGAVAFFQNFEAVEALLPIPVHILVILLCLTIPMLFGIFPLLRSSKTSVNDALNKIFYIPHRGFFRISQRLIASTRLKYGLNNLFRQGQRTVLTMLLLAVGMALYFTAANVDHSIRADLRAFSKTSPYEIVVSLPEQMEPGQVDFLSDLSFVDEVIPMKGIRMSYLPPDGGKSELTFIRVLPPEVEVSLDLMVRGKLDKTCTECLYVSGEQMNQTFKEVAIGTSISLTRVSGEVKTYRFSGVIKDLVVIGAPFVGFSEEARGLFNGLAFKLQPGVAPQELLSYSNSIDDLFIDNEINLLGLNSVTRRLAGIIGHLDPTFLIIKITGIFTIVLGLFGLIIVLNLTIQERTREIGIMKSIGSPFRKISGMFNQEFVLISLLAIVVGAVLAVPVATALIDVIAETIIRHPVAFKNDNINLLETSAIVIAIQIVLIAVYNRFKIARNARELLDHNF